MPLPPKHRRSRPRLIGVSPEVSRYAIKQHTQRCPDAAELLIRCPCSQSVVVACAVCHQPILVIAREEDRLCSHGTDVITGPGSGLTAWWPWVLP
jgi:hypothetical protein